MDHAIETAMKNVPAQEAPVIKEMERLIEAVSCACGNAEQLEKRLENYLGKDQSSTKPDEEADAYGNSSFVGELAVQTHRIKMLASLLHHLIARLDI